MMLTLALQLSSCGVAGRKDEDGHRWFYRRDRSYIMVETDIRDDTGEIGAKLWRELPVMHGAEFTDWEPMDV